MVFSEKHEISGSQLSIIVYNELYPTQKMVLNLGPLMFTALDKILVLPKCRDMRSGLLILGQWLTLKKLGWGWLVCNINIQVALASLLWVKLNTKLIEHWIPLIPKILQNESLPSFTHIHCNNKSCQIYLPNIFWIHPFLSIFALSVPTITFSPLVYFNVTSWPPTVCSYLPYVISYI